MNIDVVLLVLFLVCLASLPLGIDGTTRVNSQYWGDEIYCGPSGPVHSICSSGSNGFECPVPSGTVSHTLLCEGGSIYNEDGGGVWIGKNAGQVAECPSGRVAYAVCASGGNKDCDGSSYNHMLKCGTLKDNVEFSFLETQKASKYEDAECDDGEYVVSFCASDSGSDCLYHNDGLWYLTVVKCRKIVCKAGYDKNNQCASCPMGKFSSQPDSPCQNCDAGYFSSSLGSTSCSACAEGKYSDSGASSCTKCPAGTKQPYTGRAGLSSCESCDPGQYSIPGSSTCQQCTGDSFSLAGAGRCTPCPSGTEARSDKSGCLDINECQGNHGCPVDSECENNVRDEGSSPGRGYDCQCLPGFAVADTGGQETAGNNEIACEAIPIQIRVPSTTYKSIDFYVQHSAISLGSAQHVGCWRDEDFSDDNSVLYDPTMTKDMCVDECANRVAKYSGVGGGSQGHCWCSNEYPRAEKQEICAECIRGNGWCGGGSPAVGSVASVYSNMQESYDLHVGRYVTSSDVEALIGSPLTYYTYELEAGITVDDLEPGTPYLIEIMSTGTESAISGIKGKTSCECYTNDEPALFTASQDKGLVTFTFKDQSRCEEGFAMSRAGPDNIPEVFTSTYFYAASQECNELLTPGDQNADKLALSRLPVGVDQEYCIQAVGPGNGRGKYASTKACLTHKVAWEASISGIVKLEKHAGSLPVEDVTVTWDLIKSDGGVIPGSSGSMETGRSGEYFIVFNSEDPDLYTVDGVNRDVEVRISYAKTTNSNPHKFVCQNGEVPCSGGDYTSVFLRHLLFDVKHSATDMSTVPINGKVVIAETGTPSNEPDPNDFSVIPNTECPIIGAEVCVEVQGRQNVGEHSCIVTNSEGEFGIGAPIGTAVKVNVRYLNHTFTLDQAKYEIANSVDGFLIHGDETYEGFIFRDVEKAQLQTLVFGGLCERHLGSAEVTVTLPSCNYWRGERFTQPHVKAEHFTLAHDINVQVAIAGRHDIEMEPQTIDLSQVENDSSYQNETLTNDEYSNEMQAALSQDEDELKMLRFQYDGNTVVTVESSGNKATEYCKAQEESDGESLHVLPAYRTFKLTIAVEQDFGDDSIPRCDHMPEDTNVYLHSQVGLFDNPSDNNFIEQSELDDEVLAEYTKCSSQDREEEECIYPSCCHLDIEHTELSNGTMSNAKVTETLRVGPPFIADPYLKNIIVQVGEVQHTANVLIVGDYDDGVPDRYPLPAMDPIMILRDPPGSGSYAYYNNVRTTSSIRVKGVDGYMGFNVGLHPGKGVDSEVELCAGVGVSTCEKSFAYKVQNDNYFENDSKWTVKHEDDTYETSFVTTWSYQTSAEAGPAGHRSDIFVVPSMSLLLHEVTEISFNTTTCHGVSEPKVKFDAESDRNENAISFLSRDGLNEMIISLTETLESLNGMASDTNRTTSYQEAASSTSDLVQRALDLWEQIITDYDTVNGFGADANLINPSNWFKEMAGECPWDLSKVCPVGVGEHWSSLIPAELAGKVDERLGLEEWEEVKLISFSGGGGELHYTLDKSYSQDFERMTGGHNDNSEQEYGAGQKIDFQLKVWKILFDSKLSMNLKGSEVKTSFKHDISKDDSSMGFVLSDADDGDRFDVKIGIDPTYGSFVFKTVGGLSKCGYEEGTDQREMPSILLQSRPSGEILPDQPAVFVVQLGNLGQTSNEYDLSIERRDNTGGLAVYSSGASLAVNQHYEYMDPEETVDTTISIFRGPVLYEYDPIQLRFESRCDPSAFATYELFTHIRESDSKKVIRFARECPSVALDGWLGTGRVTINAKMGRKVPLLVQNVEKSVRGSLAEIAANVDETLDEVQLLYRKLGTPTWLRAQKSDGSQMVDVDLVFSEEDNYGFVHDEWKTNQLLDGEYEVMVQSTCPSAPVEFREATTKISILKLDTIPPEPFAFPSETDAYHVGEPMIFEYDEELRCGIPFGFSVDLSVSEDTRVFNKDNLLVVCEDRMIGIQFDGSKYDFDDLAGKTANVTLRFVRDYVGNKGDDVTTTVHFSSAPTGSTTRRLTSVPSIKVFKKARFATHIMAVDENEMPSTLETRLQARFDVQSARFDALQNMLLAAIISTFTICLGSVLFLWKKQMASLSCSENIV